MICIYDGLRIFSYHGVHATPACEKPCGNLAGTCAPTRCYQKHCYARASQKLSTYLAPARGFLATSPHCFWHRRCAKSTAHALAPARVTGRPAATRAPAQTADGGRASKPRGRTSKSPSPVAAPSLRLQNVGLLIHHRVGAQLLQRWKEHAAAARRLGIVRQRGPAEAFTVIREGTAQPGRQVREDPCGIVTCIAMLENLLL